MSVKNQKLESLTKIESTDENIAKRYWQHVDEIRPFLDSEDDEIILRGLKFFNQLMELNVDENTAELLYGYNFFPSLFKIFFTTTDLTILLQVLILLNKFAEKGYLEINESDLKDFAIRAESMYSTYDYDIYQQLFKYLINITSEFENFAQILLENDFLLNSYKISLGNSAKIPEKYAIFADFCANLIHFQFDHDLFLESFVDVAQIICSMSFEETIAPLLDMFNSIQGFGYKLKLTNIDPEFFTTALKTNKGLKNLLQFLQNPSNRYILDIMWEPQFRMLLSGACVSGKRDVPETIMYFLLKIVDYWKPLPEDLFISSALLLIVQGSFLQRFAAALYIQKLFSFAEFDFIVAVIHMDFLGPLNVILEETNDELFGIGLNLSIMIAITCEKGEIELEKLPKFDQIVETLKSIDEFELPSEQQELFETVLKHFHISEDE